MGQLRFRGQGWHIRPILPFLRPLVLRLLLNELRFGRTEQHTDGIVHAGRFSFAGDVRGREWPHLDLFYRWSLWPRRGCGSAVFSARTGDRRRIFLYFFGLLAYYNHVL
jgi:hypothetical protein